MCSLSIIRVVYTFGFLKDCLHSEDVGATTAGYGGNHFPRYMMIFSHTLVGLALGCFLLGFVGLCSDSGSQDLTEHYLLLENPPSATYDAMSDYSLIFTALILFSVGFSFV